MFLMGYLGFKFSYSHYRIIGLKKQNYDIDAKTVDPFPLMENSNNRNFQLINTNLCPMQYVVQFEIFL